jgi:hypothetical protein
MKNFFRTLSPHFLTICHLTLREISSPSMWVALPRLFQTGKGQVIDDSIVVEVCRPLQEEGRMRPT